MVRPEIRSTSSVDSNRLNLLLYGRAGIGKTVSLGTAPSPIILSAEAGMLSLLSRDIPYISIRSISDLRDVYQWLLSSEEAERYETVCLDSVSEVCDLAFAESRKRVGSEIPVLYSELRSVVLPILSAFRGLSKHLVGTARETVKDLKDGRMVMPSMVGNRLTEDLPYLFDMVLHYTLDDEDRRVIYTNSECGSVAKDRTGLLPSELRDLDNLVGDILEYLEKERLDGSVEG